MDRVRFATRRPRGRLASGSGRWRIAVAALASLLHAGGRAASGFEYRWFSDESTYLSELAGPVFTNDFGTTPPPGSIPNPLQAAGAAGSYAEYECSKVLYILTLYKANVLGH